MKLVKRSEVKLGRKTKAIEFSQELKENLNDFVKDHDLAELYRKYSWKNDTWANDFISILNLEKGLSGKAKRNSVKQEDIQRVVKWGGGTLKVKWCETVRLSLYDERGHFKEEVREDPSIAAQVLKEQKENGLISGLGITYLAKVLRFVAPCEFGAIDSRIVRVFGQGDTNSKQHNWLSLTAYPGEDEQRWAIREQSTWPKEYGKWVKILRFLASLLNSQNNCCPHREPFIENGLRQKGVWVCADIEMALFAYASQHINLRKLCCQ
ncbi:MAG: hypothetical protein V3U19_00795 [Thermodesulfobacteriota bacterium]